MPTLDQWQTNLIRRLSAIGSTEQSLIWKEKVTPSGRSVFQLAPWTPPIADSGSIGSPWPTPMAGTPAQNGNNYAGNNDGTRKMEVILGLRETVNGPKTGWATPTARDWRSGAASETTMERNARPLNEQMVNLASWGTPRLQSNGNPIRADDRRGRLEDQVFGPTPNGSNAPTEKRGAPNPEFACWLMGWPEELTSGALREIQLFRKSRRKS